MRQEPWQAGDAEVKRGAARDVVLCLRQAFQIIQQGALIAVWAMCHCIQSRIGRNVRVNIVAVACAPMTEELLKRCILSLHSNWHPICKISPEDRAMEIGMECSHFVGGEIALKNLV